jgi:hypothetical protein
MRNYEMKPINSDNIFVFDADMEEELAKHDWYENEEGYMRSFHLYAHQLVMGGSKDGMCIDHIDRDKKNNRRSNLRFVTPKENSRNRGMPINNTTGFKGVTLDKRSGIYYASISLDGKKKHLGSAETAEEAARKYDKSNIWHYGSYGVTNTDLGLLPETEEYVYDKRFCDILREIESTARGSKTADYSETWTRLGLVGIYVKIFIKEGRLNNLIWKSRGKKRPSNESIRDTLMDLAAYAIYGIICLDENNITGEGAEQDYLQEMYDAIGKRLDNKGGISDENIDD